MKYTIFYILLFVLAASGCTDKTEVEPNKWALPPITSEGANTLGCYINGEPFVADYITSGWGGASKSIDARFENNHFIFLDGKDYDLDKSSLVISSYYNNQFEDYRYDKDSSGLKTQYIDFSQFGGRPYYILEEEPQWVKVHSFKDNEYVSGTFQFTGVSSEGDTVRINDGRFDIALD